MAGSCQRGGDSGGFLWMLYKENLGSKKNAVVEILLNR